MGITLNQLIGATKKLKSFIDKDIAQLEGADFESENGFGGLRIKDGKYQYYNENLSKWIDVQVTNDNLYISNCIANPVTEMTVAYDESLKIKLTEPKDTIINGVTLFTVEAIKVLIKKGSEPASDVDGDLILELPKKKFGEYKDKWFESSYILEVGTYYIKAFAYNNIGVANNDGICKTLDVEHKLELYQFKIDQSESDPASMISYVGNNELYTPAKMNYGTDKFDYGDWKNAWFMKQCKPCMLRYDGTVDYYLDPDNYAKKVDGTNSDIANTDYEGNAMIEFPKVYISVKTEGDISTISVSNKKNDDSYHCYAHIDGNGNEMDVTYMPIYNGSLVSNNNIIRLRSLSGSTCAFNTYTYLMNSAKNNYTDSDIYNIETYNDRLLISILLLLIGKNMDTSSVFGNGDIFYRDTAVLNTGSMNDKGLFWGSNSSSTATGVKVFGMENYWGNQNRMLLGLLIDINGIQKVKMYKTDGNDYNLTGEGYHEIGSITGTSGSYIAKAYISDYGILPKVLGGSASTYFAADARFLSSSSCLATAGGCNYYKSSKLLTLNYIDPSINNWSVGAALSCKPLKK